MNIKRCYEIVVEMQRLIEKPHFVIIQNIDFPIPKFDDCQTYMFYNDTKDNVTGLLIGLPVNEIFLKFNQFSHISFYIVASDNPSALKTAKDSLRRDDYEAKITINITNL